MAEALQCRLYGGSAFLFGLPCPTERLVRYAADFVQQLANFDLQPPPALLNAIEDIILNARTIHLQQMVQKFPGLPCDQPAATDKRQEQIGKPAPERLTWREPPVPEMAEPAQWRAVNPLEPPSAMKKYCCKILPPE
ncbi:MAG: hypothetical protein WA294_11360 [Acidobacteriaceae bacterium]